MRHIGRRILFESFKVADLFVMVLAFGVAMLFEQQSSTASLEQFLAMRVSLLNLILFLALMLFWRSLFIFLGMYHSMRLSSRWTEVLEVVKTISIGTVLIYAGAVLFNVVVVTPLFILVFWVLAVVYTVFIRMILRMILARIREKGRNACNLLLVGTNKRAMDFASIVQEKRYLGYMLIGFVDTHWKDREPAMQECYPLIAPEDLADFLKNNVVDEVLICLPPREYYNQYDHINTVCAEQGVIVRILADFFFAQLAQSRVEHFEGRSIITPQTGNMEGIPLLCKRFIDITVSAALLVLLFPLMLIIGMVIKAGSPGPVFFVQKRLGLNKRIFNFYKFRTMVENAEAMQKDLEGLNEADGPVFKIKKDPRVTRVGGFLRKTSLDELPQLLNVIKGDMSLVGPRPLPIRDYQGFNQHWFNRRFSIRPGITCIWQIDGRSNIPFEKWIQLDLQYIDTWSLWLDFQILLGTVPAVLKCRGAS